MSGNGKSEPDLTELLQRKGYLRSPVDRLFLTSFGSFLTSGKGIVQASLAASLVTGALLALLLTLGIQLVYPGPDNLLFFFIYLVPLVFSVFVCIAVLLGFLKAAFRIHVSAFPQRVSQLLSMILALLSAFWLWFPLFSLLDMVFLRISAVLLWSALTLLVITPALKTVVLITHRNPGELPTVRPARHLLGLFLLILILLALILFRTGPSAPVQGEMDLSIATLPPSTALIVLDGIGLGDLKDLETFQLLATRSSIFTLEDQHRLVPVVNWTETFTGFSADVNGVSSLDAYRFPFSDTAFSALPLICFFHHTRLVSKDLTTRFHRITPTVWEWTGAFGLQTNSVNCWSSWPPWRDEPWIVSNAELMFRLYGKRSGAFQPDHLGELLPAVPDIRHKGLQLDLMALDVFKKLQDRHPAQFSVLYLPGMDILLSDIHVTDYDNLSRIDRQTRVHIRTLSDEISRLSESCDRMVLILHPGRNSAGNAHLLLYPGTGDDSAGSIQSLQITPLLLSQLGLPVHKNMMDDLPDIPWSPAEIRTVEVFPRQSLSTVSHPPPMEELKSLGYLQ